ncbi:MAG: Rieske 2Fe-2S domain-containing protein [Bacteroidales bacterium]|nr:Rieske 2Fe-2S domain-containing protein [Bacteroidales bacterium]
MKRIGVFFLIFLLMALSCGEEESRQTVPYAPVNFRVDPNGVDYILRNNLSYKIFTENEAHTTTDRFGYAGVLVVTDANGALYAFDLCCPHEENRNVTVSPEYEGNGYGGKVKCSACGSVYVTMFGLGNVESGPSAESLQRYNVIRLQDGSWRVVN